MDVVAFDVNETLFSLDRLGPAFASVGLDARSVPLWFARVLRDGFCLTVVGEFASFADIAAEQLRALDPEQVDDGAVASVMEAFHELEPFPEAEAALKLLRDTGVRVVTLTNGGADWIRRLLERANLDSYVEQNLSVEAVRRWKPAPDVYLLRGPSHRGVTRPGRPRLGARSRLRRGPPSWPANRAGRPPQSDSTRTLPAGRRRWA